MIARAKIVVLLCGFLFGCKASQEPLLLEVSDTPIDVSEPISDVAQLHSGFPRYSLDASFELKRDPFSIPESINKATHSSNQCPQSDNFSNNNSINLPLDDLRLAGVIGRKTDYIALIELPSGGVIRVVIGQRIGLEQNIITDISSKVLTISRWTLEDGQCQLVVDTRLKISR
ncbi:pilus assembly protein PilP [Vibrio aquimaris]|uniref:Pilus assembly protein, PilP n=1 Tax=Vibrio aquimaris TaxID=2587862 RepID=A0A5P9CFS9_9VIBR|nr:pilus assembly protein PilP [Vibrio aquimaris]QFT25064.1 Pilus assembly protein, PilP [Vibrio aquimaris]